MFKELIDAAVASLLEPYAEEIRKLKAENVAFKSRIVALEARPDPFDTRHYIEDQVKESIADIPVPDAEEIAESISDRRLKKLFEDVDLDSKLSGEVSEWASEQDWTAEIKQAMSELAEEGSLDEAIASAFSDKPEIVEGAVSEILKERTLKVTLE